MPILDGKQSLDDSSYFLCWGEDREGQGEGAKTGVSWVFLGGFILFLLFWPLKYLSLSSSWNPAAFFLPALINQELLWLLWNQYLPKMVVLSSRCYFMFSCNQINDYWAPTAGKAPTGLDGADRKTKLVIGTTIGSKLFKQERWKTNFGMTKEQDYEVFYKKIQIKYNGNIYKVSVLN